MKKIFLLISMASLSIFLLNSCDDKKDNKENRTQTLLVEARILFANGEYNKALQMIDSIYRATPITLHEITKAELLGDSIIKVVNQNKIDSLSETINQYKIEMNKENTAESKVQWTKKIENAENMRTLLKLRMDNTHNKEYEDLECIQYESMIRQR